MAKRQRFSINGIDFASKKAVLEYVKKEIHSQYDDHQDLSNQHLDFMVSLLRYHPWSDQKIGVGVKRIWIQPNDIYPTKGFWLERIDGSKTDFSFYQCVQPASPLRDFKAACRNAVAMLMIYFRHERFGQKDQDGKIRCPLSGDMISIYESHVDHAPPNTFDVIVNEFIIAKNINVNAAPVADHSDGHVGSFFTDEVLKAEWVAFHNAMATLRVVSAKANLSLPKTQKA